MMSTNEYVEVRNGGYYVAGTRIGLDPAVCDFREGRFPEEIFRSYPSIAFILEHPKEMLEPFLRARTESALKSA